MEPLGFGYIVELVKAFGLPGAILLLWWLDQKSQSRMITQYREDTKQILEQYGRHMDELKTMYKNNVGLVEDYGVIAKSLHELIAMNTRVMTQVCDDVRNNQFCPNVRLEKKAHGVQK